MLIDETAALNKDFNRAKKEVDASKEQLKKQLVELEITEYDTGNNKITFNDTVKESFDIPKTVEKLKELGANWLIKTVEVVDIDELETSIFNGELDATQFKDCVVTSVSKTLRFSKGGKKCPQK